MKKTKYIFFILSVIKFSFGAEANAPLKHNGFSLTSVESKFTILIQVMNFLKLFMMGLHIFS